MEPNVAWEQKGLSQITVMLADWLPKAFSRLRIFLCYSSEYRTLAEEIAQTLRNAGDKVFFDRDTLPPGRDYNERIRKAVRSANRFVFLASHSALAEGKYTLTELDFAKKRWPAPIGQVLPVLVDPKLQPSELPAYLRSLNALRISGNGAAEVAAEIDRSRSLNWFALTSAVLVICATAAGLSLAIYLPKPSSPADIVLLTDKRAIFRPLAQPPSVDLRLASAETQWIESNLTITTQITYSHRSPTLPPVQIFDEEMSLTFGHINAAYRAAYLVEIKSDGSCDNGKDWLCIVRVISGENVESGRSSPSRETMFLPTGVSPVTWRQFIDQVTAKDGPAEALVVVRARAVVASGQVKMLQFDCRIDVAGVRAAFAKFTSGKNPRPSFWVAHCQSDSDRGGSR